MSTCILILKFFFILVDVLFGSSMAMSGVVLLSMKKPRV